MLSHGSSLVSTVLASASGRGGRPAFAVAQGRGVELKALGTTAELRACAMASRVGRSEAVWRLELDEWRGVSSGVFQRDHAVCQPGMARCTQTERVHSCDGGLEQELR